MERDVKSMAHMRMGGSRNSVFATDAQNKIADTIKKIKTLGKLSEEEIKEFSDPLEEVSLIIGKHDAFIEDLTAHIIDIYNLGFEHEMKYNEYHDDFLNTLAGLMNFLSEQLKPVIMGKHILDTILGSANIKNTLFFITDTESFIRDVVSSRFEIHIPGLSEKDLLSRHISTVFLSGGDIEKSLNRKVPIKSSLMVAGESSYDCKITSRLLFKERKLEGMLVSASLSSSQISADKKKK